MQKQKISDFIVFGPSIDGLVQILNSPFFHRFKNFTVNKSEKENKQTAKRTKNYYAFKIHLNGFDCSRAWQQRTRAHTQIIRSFRRFACTFRRLKMDVVS